MMRSANPALRDQVFESMGTGHAQPMTLEGTVNKSFLLIFITILGASYVWLQLMNQNVTATGKWLFLGMIAGLILGLITIFKKEWSPITAPCYALSQGLFLGGISSMLELQYPGIVIQATGLTFGVFFCLLLAYKSGKIRPTENFKLGLMSAMGGIMLFYFVAIIMSLFGFNLNVIYGSGPLGIAFSLFVVVIAALNLVMDFDFIETGARVGAPKYMEWYAAFGLLVTLIWLYMEILRLLAKLRDRR